MGERIALITGSTSGIGLATARLFAQRGWKVIIHGRREQLVKATENELIAQWGERIAGGIVADVASRAECHMLIEKSLKLAGRLDALILNAGISMRAVFHLAKPEVLEQVMRVNFWGAVWCAYYAIPHLIESKGSIIAVSSIAGYIGLPARTLYCASKAAMNRWAEALRRELYSAGVHVGIVAPGWVNTPIRYKALTASGEPQQDTPLDEESALSPEKVAEAIWKAVTKRKREIIIPQVSGRWNIFITNLLKPIADRVIWKRFYSEKGSPLRQLPLLK